MLTTQKQEQDTFGGYLTGWYNITPLTPTGDMQHGMDAVMQMAMPMPTAEAAGGAAPSTGGTHLPRRQALAATASRGCHWRVAF